MSKSATFRLCCCFSFLLLLVVAGIISGIVFFTKTKCSDGYFMHGAVAADSETCSVIGRDILQQGGSAVDGAIAALLCTSLVNPQSMGLGGGSIFTVMDKMGNVKVITSREKVPRRTKADLLKSCPKIFQLLTGSEWIAVPGEIRGYKRAHDLYGKLPWAKLFEPVIRLAREGFPLPPYLGKVLHILKQLIEGSHLCDVFCNSNKTVLRPGELLKFPKLAETLETIAKEGADAFYTGRIANDLIEDITDAGGSLTREDLASFQASETDPLVMQLGDYKMFTPPPPAGGALLGFTLNIMNGFSLSRSSIDGDQKALTFHRYVEALKFANGQRPTIRDPGFNPDVMKEAGYLISDEFANRVRMMINNSMTHDPQYYNITPSLDHFGTSHVSVLAEDGTAVSVTSTINHFFGSMVYSRRTGVILNNELADFCNGQGHLQAGEQPPSSMAPSILYSKSKNKLLLIGGSGGSMITTGVASALMNHLWFEKNLQQAISDPVLYVNPMCHVEVEKGFDEGVVDKLKQLGHSLGSMNYSLNVVNAISREGSCISAMSDTRKLGKAAGY
ncbi:glutathione hydrolase 5 proenzyme-like isoform X2 [Brienomyrus brachyistius]|uniref:glutathione hydrolase 5 proenzyme-like isoform X2 n=1 Tax=Brienomyrus brachyistius TaxID=42636 RepID=UPI0020B29AEF|nr:glutathione hydrolase 5 proenzyme-like isoform X2 [Brienomyrus brachyistius]